MAGRRYFWLKLPEDFFRRGYIRRLRRTEDGDRLAVIYLEMLLAALKTDGALTCAPGEDLAEELALELYEEPADVATVLKYLSDHGKLIRENEAEYRLTDSEELTGSETPDAGRMREARLRKKAAAPCAAKEPAVPLPLAPDIPQFASDEEFAESMLRLRRN